jgi:hypothetical protein
MMSWSRRSLNVSVVVVGVVVTVRVVLRVEGSDTEGTETEGTETDGRGMEIEGREIDICPASSNAIIMLITDSPPV